MGGPGLAPGTAAETPRQGAPSWAPVFCASWTTSFPALTGPRGQVPPPRPPPATPTRRSRRRFAVLGRKSVLSPLPTPMIKAYLPFGCKNILFK